MLARTTSAKTGEQEEDASAAVMLCFSNEQCQHWQTHTQQQDSEQSSLPEPAKAAGVHTALCPCRLPATCANWCNVDWLALLCFAWCSEKGWYCPGGDFSGVGSPNRTACPADMTTVGKRSQSLRACGEQEHVRAQH